MDHEKLLDAALVTAKDEVPQSPCFALIIVLMVFLCSSTNSISLATMQWVKKKTYCSIHTLLSHIYCVNVVKQNVSPLFSPESSDTFTLDVLVSLLRQENAVDICVIKVPEQIKYTQYFIVVSGVSPRHLRAMALYAIKVVTTINFLMIKCWYVEPFVCF